MFLLAQFSLYVHKGGLKPDSFFYVCFYDKLHIQDWLEMLEVVDVLVIYKCGKRPLCLVIIITIIILLNQYLKQNHIFVM